MAPTNSDVARRHVRVMFVLDTNLVSELRKVRSGKANLGVACVGRAGPVGRAVHLHDHDSTNSSTACCSWSVPDPAQGAAAACLARPERRRSVQESSASRSTGALARRSPAGLHVPDPAPFRDALIGATALVHDMTVVTRDLKDFQRFDELRRHRSSGS